MTAFVLSGGANRGSVQAGMLEALLDAGIRPDLPVGKSIGAANAAFLAADPSPEQARRLSALWRRVQPHDVFPINPLRMARALVCGTGLFPTTGLRRLLQRELPCQTIQQAAAPLRIVAARLEDGAAVVFDAGPVVDAVLASAALPGIFPPHRCESSRPRAGVEARGGTPPARREGGSRRCGEPPSRHPSAVKHGQWRCAPCARRVLDRGLAYHQIAALSSGMAPMVTVLLAVRLRSVTV